MLADSTLAAVEGEAVGPEEGDAGRGGAWETEGKGRATSTTSASAGLGVMYEFQTVPPIWPRGLARAGRCASTTTLAKAKRGGLGPAVRAGRRPRVA